ncbi:MAG: hypothetical protein AAFY84_16840 [Pseudomonadota bacterium]
MENGTQNAAVNIGGPLILGLFVLIVFDNLALAIITVLLFGGAAAARSNGKKEDSETTEEPPID